MLGYTSMPSVDVAASPECAMLISVTSRHHLYVCIGMTCSVTRLQIRKSKPACDIRRRGRLVSPRTSGQALPLRQLSNEPPNVEIRKLVK